jgi:ABC-2 type transport system permease protein
VSCLRAELRRLLTLPSLRWTVALTLAGTALLAWADAPPVRYTQAGFLVLGVLAAEHPATALLAVPQRLRLFAGQVVTLGAVTVPVAFAGTATAYLTLATLFGFAVGRIVRQALPALLMVFGTHLIAAPLLRVPSLPEPVDGMAAAVVWTAVALAAGGVVFLVRDA